MYQPITIKTTRLYANHVFLGGVADEALARRGASARRPRTGGAWKPGSRQPSSGDERVKVLKRERRPVRGAAPVHAQVNMLDVNMRDAHERYQLAQRQPHLAFGLPYESLQDDHWQCAGAASDIDVSR